jgi:putative membrane protein (TIGR04086 family)
MPSPTDVPHPTSIQWRRVLVGGVLAEIGILLVAVPVAFLPSGERALLWAIPPACLVMTFVVGRWTARRVGARHVLHGTLVGVVAAVIYIVMTWSQTLPLAYIVSHGLKVAGGAAGGLAAAKLPT